MKCPVCPDATLAMSNREGIEIDYCPSCRGVWLDRGELDKIIERSAIQGPVASSAPHGAGAPRHDEVDRGHRYRDEREYHKHKRPGFLGDLFDFD